MRPALRLRLGALFLVACYLAPASATAANPNELASYDALIKPDGFFNAKSFLTGMIDRVRRIARNGWRTSLVEVLLERSEPGRLGHL